MDQDGSGVLCAKNIHKLAQVPGMKGGGGIDGKINVMDMVMARDRAFFLIPIGLRTRAAQVDDRVQVVTSDNRSQCHRVELTAAINQPRKDSIEIGLKL